MRMVDGGAPRAKYIALRERLDERLYRLCLAADALTLGYGGISRVAEASGVSRITIHAGLRDLKEGKGAPGSTGASEQRRVRRPGGGREMARRFSPGASFLG